ncbi:MAG: hypothetical protein JXR36_14875 [Bacteroidales bacterium]|nr:hypothetical protein [Bacteroidales bacterium]
MMKNRIYNGLKTSYKFSSVLFATFVAIIFMYSCASSEIADSKDVNQAKIYQAYWVNYDAGENSNYNVEAQFRFGGAQGTTLRLSEPSKVTVNGQEMDEKSDMLRGCYYRTQISDKSEFNFLFMDTEEKEYKNKCIINSIDFEAIEEIETLKSYEFDFVGKGLEQKEKAFLVIEDSEKNTVTVSSDIVGSNTIKISKNDIENLVSGNGQIYVYRTYTSDLNESADEGGKIYTEYKSKKYGVYIKSPKVSETN